MLLVVVVVAARRVQLQFVFKFNQPPPPPSLATSSNSFRPIALLASQLASQLAGQLADQLAGQLAGHHQNGRRPQLQLHSQLQVATSAGVQRSSGASVRLISLGGGGGGGGNVHLQCWRRRLGLDFAGRRRRRQAKDPNRNFDHRRPLQRRADKFDINSRRQQIRAVFKWRASKEMQLLSTSYSYSSFS